MVEVGTTNRTRIEDYKKAISKDTALFLWVHTSNYVVKGFTQAVELKDMVVLGGNMRLKACKEAGLKEVYVLKADDLTEEQQKEFIVKDKKRPICSPLKS